MTLDITQQSLWCVNSSSPASEESAACGCCDSQMKYFALCDAGSASLGPESMRQRGAMCAERESPGSAVNYSLESPHSSASAAPLVCAFRSTSWCRVQGCPSELCLCVLHFFLNWKGKINNQRSEKGTGFHLRIISCPCQQKGCAWCGFI